MDLRIAYLILCHNDAVHIGRLARRLVSGMSGNAVFIHVDKKANIQEELILSLKGVPNVCVIKERYQIYWGGFSAISATYALLRAAVNNGGFDRYVLLQGADYPIKSNQYIADFYNKNNDVEYIRAVNCATSEKQYFYAKARYSLIFNHRNLLTKIRNKLVRILDLKLKPKQWAVDGKLWNVYWGCAQFAVTHKCVELFLKYETHEALIKHFSDIFPADEAFFPTIVYNSDLVLNTTYGHPESDQNIHNLVDLINLTYFEYPVLVTIFTQDDYQKIVDLPHLYVRKVCTTESSELLDMIDRHSKAETWPCVSRSSPT